MGSDDSVNAMFDARLLQALAVGMEDEDAIFRRFNLSEEDHARMMANEAFVKNIAIFRDEMERDGSMTRLRARWMTKDLLEKIYVQTAHKDAPLDDALEALKVFSKIADVDAPSRGQAQASGPSFKINIIIPGESPVQKALPIDVTPKPAFLDSAEVPVIALEADNGD